MKPKLTILFFIFFSALSCFGQTNKNNQHSNLYLGPGAGLDYGGLGLRAEFIPIKKFSIIGGIGYNLFTIPGMNAGISYKLYEHKRSAYHIAAMYGYNAVIRIKYNNSLGSYTDVQAYYGPSAGAGCDIYDKRKKNKLSVEIWVPFRNSDFRNRHEGLKDMGFKFRPDILPVIFSIGYNFSIALNKNKKPL